MSETNILAIDCGGTTGWACFTFNKIESGVVSFAIKRGESKGMVFLLFSAWLNRILDLMKPDLVIYEKAYSKGHAAQETLDGMNTRIMEQCEKRKIQCSFVYATQIKKYALKTGKGTKDDMLKAARNTWGKVNVEDHNQADALFMLQWARDNLL